MDTIRSMEVGKMFKPDNFVYGANKPWTFFVARRSPASAFRVSR